MRSRIAGRSWRRLCPVILFHVCLCTALGTEAWGRNDWISVLRDDDRGLELLLEAPTLVREGEHARVPGFAVAAEPGSPVLYEQAVLVGVPGPRGATLEVLGTESIEIEGVQPEIVAAPRQAGDAHVLAPTVPRAGPHRAVVEISAAGQLRQQDVVVLTFRPLQFGADGKASYVRQAHLRITFTDSPALRPHGARHSFETAVHSDLQNAATASRWALAPRRALADRARADSDRGTLRDLPPDRLRIRISHRGVYALTFAGLLDAGVPVDDPAFDPRTFRLFFDTWTPVPLFADSTPSSWQSDYEMQESALWVPGEEDGSFDLDDRVVFHSLGPREYVDLTGARADSLLYAEHPYENFVYASLVWGEQLGLRMQVISAATPEPIQDPVITRVWHRVHLEQNNFFGEADDLWIWSTIRRNTPTTLQVDLDLAGVPFAPGHLRIGIGASDLRGNGQHALDVHWNGEPAGEIHWSQPVTRPPNAYFDFPITMLPRNDLALSIQPDPFVSDGTLLMELDMSWERPLVAAPGGTLAWSHRAGATLPIYELAGFGARAPLVFDASDPLRPARLVDPSPSAGDSTLTHGEAHAAETVWRVRHGRGAGVRAHYIALAEAEVIGSADVELRHTQPLRQRTSSPDMLIVAHESLLGEAQRLAAHRIFHFPAAEAAEILVVSTADIYDNFSGGRMDPLAIRNCAKFLYELEPEAPRLRYLLLFGDATLDPRQLLATSEATLVPTVHPWYADARVRREYAIDEWLGEMDAPFNRMVPAQATPLSDLAIGRITARTIAEARRIVDKIVAYDTAPVRGRWRGRVLLAADDECQFNSCFETVFVENAEEIARRVPVEYDIEKVYLTEFEKVLGQKPEGRHVLIETWSEGAAFLQYSGHGAPRQLADEVLFLSSDIPVLANEGKLPLFMALASRVGKFDTPGFQGMSEDLLASGTGGAIACIADTRSGFASPGSRLSQALVERLFEKGATTRASFGLALLGAKASLPGFDASNSQSYVLLGDPAATLQLPQALITLSSPDTLITGRMVRVDGFVYAPDDSMPVVDFEGEAEVEVLGSVETSGYTVPPFVHLEYELPGAPIYRGPVPIVAGRFEFRFTVPPLAGLEAARDSMETPVTGRPAASASSPTRPQKRIRLGNGAAVTVYAMSNDRDALGARRGLVLVHPTEEIHSVAPPVILLGFEQGGTRVPPGAILQAEIHDENGVEIRGSSERTSILLDFDGSRRLDVTKRFVHASGADTSGMLRLALPEELAPGRHTATLTAADKLGITSAAMLDFEITVNAAGLTDVLAFPNPFRDRTWFLCRIGAPSEVEVRVYTSSGREVWWHRGTHEEPGQVAIQWSGTDAMGDPLGNGVYLYRVLTTSSGQSPQQYTGKVVVMHE